MDQLEFLVEEPSMAEVLKTLLPQVLPEGWLLNNNCFIRVHAGKQDLQRSIPTKIRAARNRHGQTFFFILQDQDANDCRQLKKKLVDICNEARQEATNVSFLVRIVCHELESWYLGDLAALTAVFPRFKPMKISKRSLLNNPDAIVNPKGELKRRVGEYPQIDTARKMSAHMTLESNRSKSLACLIRSVRGIPPILDEQ